MLDILISIAAFIVAIAILVTVHEFGHFWVARKLGVKILRFSIGFGKALWRRVDKHQTEFVIAAVPLGGYVKMLDEREGEVSEADKPFAFNTQPLSSRIAIVVAGPLFNILFAVFAYWLTYVIGISTVAPVLGSVSPDSIAAQAGLQRGQEIVAVADEATTSWRAFSLALLSHAGDNKSITVDAKNRETGEITSHVFALQGWHFDNRKPDILGSLGLSTFRPHIPPVINKVLPDSPAEKANLQAEDKIIAINNVAINSWKALLDYVDAHPNQEAVIQLERQGAPLQLTIQIGGKEVDAKMHGFLGVLSHSVKWPKDMIRIQRYSLLNAWWPAVKQTAAVSLLTFQVVGKLLVGKLSIQTMSGPIGIAQIAGDTVRIGISYFLGFLAFISISLGVINILPIPMLDGGHLLFYLIEAVIRRPVPQLVERAGLKIGLFFILLMMSIAMYNDILRFV